MGNSSLWRSRSSMFQISLMHHAPKFPSFGVYLIFSSLFLGKGSLGLGLDAPKLEMSQVVSGSPNHDKIELSLSLIILLL